MPSTDKKLLLTYPNQRWHKTDVNTTWNLNPYTLCILAALVRDEVEVKILDAHFYNMTIGEFERLVREYGPDYIGISVMSTEYKNILDITADVVKKINPDIVVIAGGVHVTMEYENVMKNPDIDYAIRGEGEYVLRDLIRHLNGAGDFPAEGVVFRDNGAVKAFPQVYIKDISELPWPDYGLIKLEDYLRTGPRHGPLRPPEYPYIRMSVTRGCPFGCSFCQVATISGRKVRTRSPEDVVNEMLFLKKKYGIKSIQFDDDNIIMDKHFLRRLLELMIEKRVDVKFIIGAFAVFLLNEEILDLLVKSGCVGLNVAIESGNKRVLREIVQKPVDLDKAKLWIGKIREKGLFCIANFIIGFPGETWEEIRDTVHFAETCGADYIKIFVAVPLKGTRLWERAVEAGAIRDNGSAKIDWRHSQISSDEWTAKDVSILRAYEWDRINFATPEKRRRVAELWGMSEQELDKIRKETRDLLCV
ncbi:MAG: B12-binding domain-containing radical SAM protein [Nitrospirae bacterium]|nr:B12-binding domain-containing radical SAM protein [Nitrospirota bacterium]